MRILRFSLTCFLVLQLPGCSAHHGNTTTSSPFISTSAGAGAAVAHSIPIPSAGQINTNRHHYTLQLVKGWISSEDHFVRALFAKKSGVVVYLETSTTLFDGKVITTAETITIPEHDRNTDIPWSTRRTLLDRMPGDAPSRLTLRVQIDRENNLTKIFSAAEGAKSLLGDIFSSGWGAYARIVGELITSLFGTAGSSSPFYWLAGDVILHDPQHPDSVRPEYIVLITPRSTKGPEPDPSRFTVDPTGTVLLYDGRAAEDALTGRSFVLLRLFKDQDFDITQQTLGNGAAWAILAERFLYFHLSTADSAKLASQQGDLLDALQTEARLLKDEPRFTKLDRARALHMWATVSADAIRDRCRAISLADAHCPIGDLETYRRTIAAIFALPQDVARDLPQASQEDIDKWQQRVRIR